MAVHYLSPGPSRLPDPVRERIHRELLDTFGIGVSIMEISHRSPQYTELSEQTLELVSRVLGIPTTHALIMTPFGAQQHFSLLIHHLSQPGDTISYAETGVWAALAVRDARASGRKLDLVFSGAPNFRSLGDVRNYKVDPQSRFLHLTINNTVYGTEYPKIPDHFDVPLVLDMTSSLAARTDIPWPKVGLIYASAQKNFGIAGMSFVIVRKDLLEHSPNNTSKSPLGDALCYLSHFNKRSALNTPPVLPIFASNRMFQWIEEQGGVPAMEKIALQKAELVYREIDSGFYKGLAETSCRSRHNITFGLPSDDLCEAFLAEAAQEGILEIRGYRGVGGIRASLYNGVSLASAQALASFMRHFRDAKEKR
jgi:phosphoserine aminotransferase